MTTDETRDTNKLRRERRRWILLVSILVVLACCGLGLVISTRDARVAEQEQVVVAQQATQAVESVIEEVRIACNGPASIELRAQGLCQRAEEAIRDVPPPLSGAAGAEGQPGPVGPPGAPGLPGVNGAPGAPGVPGVGSPGPTGANGSQGNSGPPGSDGAPGSPGADGTAGTDGAQGATGPEGPAGADGAPGAPGAAGSDGADGVSLVGVECRDGSLVYVLSSGAVGIVSGASSDLCEQPEPPDGGLR